jgi:hypothetical protein
LQCFWRPASFASFAGAAGEEGDDERKGEPISTSDLRTGNA